MSGSSQVALTPLNARTIAPFGELLGQPPQAPLLSRGDITYWHATADLSGLQGSGVTGHLIAHRRAYRLRQIERHNRTPEAFIALSGRSLMVLGAPGEADPAGLRVFELSAGQGVLLRQGTWHWAPYPLSDMATFLLLLRRETAEHDVEVIDIPERQLQIPPTTGPPAGPAP